jgi:hypothetical protein
MATPLAYRHFARIDPRRTSAQNDLFADE